MIRRRSTPWVLAAAATLALSSCATFSRDAARVGDSTLEGDAFRELLAAVAETPGFESFVEGDGAVDGEFARDLLNRWITGQVLLDDLAERGLNLTAELRQEVESELAAGNGALWTDSPQALRDLFIESLAAAQLFSQSNAPDPEALRADYDAGVAASGLACTRHILVETEAEALDVLEELRNGADFAALAAERSIDEGSAVNGGVIEPSPGAACFDLGTFSQGFVTEYVEAAVAATVGEPTEPVQSQFGWHVIVVRPFDEVAEAIVQAAGSAQAAQAADALIAEADVYVASKYGRFDRAQRVVVAPGR